MKTNAEDDEAQEMRERGLDPGERVSKEDADYGKGTPFRRCGLCEYLERGNKCKIVEGDIDPYDVCKYFEKPDSPRDMAHLKDVKKKDQNRMKEREIYLIRHGATALNRESGGVDRIRGMKNIPLSPEGKEEAKKLAKQLADSGITMLISSPLDRARETAEAIAETTKARVLVSRALLPWDVGDMTGKESSVAHPKMVEYATEKPNEKMPGGESFDQFKEGALDGLRPILENYRGEMIALVTHHRVERLIKAWQAAGEPSDHRIDFDVMFKHGEKTAHAEKMKINVGAL